MATPDPIAPPPPPPPSGSGAKKWLIGCLVVLLLGVVAAVAVVAIGVYAAKRQLDAMTPDARKAYEDARTAAAALGESARLAPTLAEGEQAQSRLATAARNVAPDQAMTTSACPPDPSRGASPVDAPWFRALADGVPQAPVGTPWFRHQVFSKIAEVPLGQYPGKENEALAMIAADRELAVAGAIAVIHTTRLVEPKLLDGKQFEGGRFEGFVQLIKYPEGGSICLVPFSASSSDSVGGGVGIGLRVRGISIPISDAMPNKDGQQQLDEDFQERFWAAEEAALRK
ncbi:MAG: hypothetical protein ABI588_04735 [Arenimonas sp.]